MRSGGQGLFADAPPQLRGALAWRRDAQRDSLRVDALTARHEKCWVLC